MVEGVPRWSAVLVLPTLRERVPDGGYYLVSQCSSPEEFVGAFRRYAGKESLFIPTSAPLAVGRRGYMAVALGDGSIMIDGTAEVISASTGASGLHGRVGMTVRFMDLDDHGREVLTLLTKSRAMTRPAALPHVQPKPMLDLISGTALAEARASIAPSAPTPGADPATALAESAILPFGVEPPQPARPARTTARSPAVSASGHDDSTARSGAREIKLPGVAPVGVPAGPPDERRPARTTGSGLLSTRAPATIPPPRRTSPPGAPPVVPDASNSLITEMSPAPVMRLESGSEVTQDAVLDVSDVSDASGDEHTGGLDAPTRDLRAGSHLPGPSTTGRTEGSGLLHVGQLAAARPTPIAESELLPIPGSHAALTDTNAPPPRPFVPREPAPLRADDSLVNRPLTTDGPAAPVLPRGAVGRKPPSQIVLQRRSARIGKDTAEDDMISSWLSDGEAEAAAAAERTTTADWLTPIPQVGTGALRPGPISGGAGVAPAPMPRGNRPAMPLPANAAPVAFVPADSTDKVTLPRATVPRTVRYLAIAAGALVIGAIVAFAVSGRREEPVIGPRPTSPAEAAAPAPTGPDAEGAAKPTEARATTDRADRSPTEAAARTAAVPPGAARDEVAKPAAGARTAGSGPCRAVFSSTPSGADVVIGGRVAGTTPLDYAMPCKPAVATFKRDRYEPLQRKFTPKPDGAKVAARLERPSFSVKLVSSPAGATVTMGGKRLGRTPVVAKLPGNEKVTVQFAKSGYASASEKVYARKNGAVVSVTLKKSGKKR
jgi:hypothetical protein